MDDSKNLRKNFLTNPSCQKWFVVINTVLVLFLIVIIILAGSIWFSDRMTAGVIHNIISPRVYRLILKNPDILYDITRKLNSESIALLINRLLEKDPQFLSRWINSIDPVLVAVALNKVFKENPEQINALMQNLEAKALADLNKHLLRNNRPLLVVLLTSFDHRTMGEILSESISKDPLMLSKIVEGLQPAPLSRAANTTLRGQKVFLSNLLGTLDMGSLATLIDKIAKEHPEFMNELVDKIIELIRKDFMKSGI